MMTEQEKNKYFWQQYHGEILATDLPQDYIEYDTRVYCCNEKCFVREKCRLFNYSYKGLAKLFGRTIARRCVEDEKGVWKREPWEKRANDVNYMLASFGMCPEQEGAKPCKHFIEFNSK